ncbi:MAG TPA: N-acetylmuramoyl-L-alanine amidase, partial [Ktedonobacteraceae bacterium]|nr:N-acetylmuramoyl-L-alanine amidase [Ktedonobacteraceae bacterium]
NFWDRGNYKPRYIILHGTAGATTAEALGTYFRSTTGTNNPVSSNYGIGMQGEVHEYVDSSRAAWANGALTSGHDSFWSESINPNLITISIELCKSDINNMVDATEEQYTSVVELCKQLCQIYGIPAKKADLSGGITGHFSIDPVNRSMCPGIFDWPYFFQQLDPEGGKQYMNAQFEAVWLSTLQGHRWRGSGIYGALRTKQMAGKISACAPLVDEIATVDWSGDAIKLQYFSNGVHAEFHVASGVTKFYDARNTEL